jgi:hypothetical protein
MNNPKEKARELVFMFSHEVRGIFFKKFRTKRCALIAVDEILNTIEYSSQADELSKVSYWEEVKNEINKL